MATYVNNLRLKEIATGAESGTWGTSTNTNLELIADAFGSGTEAITTNADTHTTTIADGAADEGRAIYLKYTGTLDSACTITLAPNTINKLWIIENATSGSQNIVISQGSGANITIGNGKVAAIFTDGAGSGAAVLDAFADLELSSTLTAAGNVTMSADASVGDDLSLVSDAAVLNFGADSDVNLTHVADTGLLLNSTMALQFNDASQYINAPSNAILDINATDEIELNATAVDLNGTLDVSGTSTLTGNVTMSADASVGDDLSLVSDAAVLNFGADSDVSLTHVADTGLLLNSTRQLQFNDSSQYINAPSATILDINATDEIELNATAVDLNGTLDVSGVSTLTGNVTMSADASVGDDLSLVSDAAVLNFGADSDVSLTHVADTGLLLNSTRQLQFNDSSQYINAPSATVLDINATDEIELNATAVDLNGTLDVSGASTLTGNVTMSADASVGDDLTLGSDAAVLNFGADSDVSLTHVADTGLLLNSTRRIQFNDASQYIGASDAENLLIGATDNIDVSCVVLDVAGAIAATGNVTMDSDLTVDTSTLFVDASENTVCMGTTTAKSNQKLHVVGNEGEGAIPAPNQSVALFQRNTNSENSCYVTIGAGTNSEAGLLFADKDAAESAGVKYSNANNSMIFRVNASNCFTLDSSGDATFTGAVSKGSGSFRIDHPLPSKNDTHHLVHSFIEGPRADLVYRGVATLSSGWIQVDLDEAVGMTDGTWELLCRDPQAWIQNDTGWDAVRGSVEGGTLTIECQNTDSSDTVSWMVVAERQDQHMIDAGWTDDEGRVILEPEKPEPVSDNDRGVTGE